MEHLLVRKMRLKAVHLEYLPGRENVCAVDSLMDGSKVRLYLGYKGPRFLGLFEWVGLIIPSVTLIATSNICGGLLYMPSRIRNNVM